MSLTRNAILFAAAVLMLAVTWWSFTDRSVSVEETEAVAGPVLSGYASDFVLLSTDAQGAAVYRLEAPSARYFEDSDLWLIDEPRWQLYQDDEPPWFGRADTGQSWAGGEEAELIGDVVLMQEQANGTTRLTSERFYLQPTLQYAETDHPVSLVSPTYEINAIGARAWLDEKRTELLNEARGKHE